jgi:predicted dehydrogenase
MSKKDQVNVAIVGAGFIAETRARSYAAVIGHGVRVVAVVSRSRDHAVSYARAHGVPDVYDDYSEILD